MNRNSADLDAKRRAYLKAMLAKDPKELRFCVLGAGHGGLAMAGHLALMGFQVNLFNRGRRRIQPVQERGGIRLEGEVKGFGKVALASTDIAECLEGVDVLMVVVPATGHRYMAEVCAPHIKGHQIVVLNPGRTGGALEFMHVLRQHGVQELPFIAEAQTFLYASRALGPAHAKIFSIKAAVPLATLPAYWIPGVLKVINRAFPQFVPGDNVFKTSFDNIGAVFHPALTVLNAAWIEETHGDFEYYVQGASRSVTRVLERIDKERLDVAAALGIRAMSARNWLYTAYSATGKDLYEAMHDNPGYVGIKAPDRLHHRYIDEDVPMSLVPIASIGEMLKVETPTIKAIIHLASLMRGVDFWEKGRTVDSLGLRGKSIRDIRLLAVTGEV
ncbi:MAG: NAD/NADP octopine/nopaline dehydrogenase family protein [candidate division KSB1 bacterium]|nr:NAD/NADP octopine/nopaline dehydrogenase family protein [candidate division KSB1 bacterium]MDZ7338442.1 NAD/NADP octopine/nopaline dehydrogenase family protein [candidate division KSB1 bacterium]MDZ7385623.1 NAD/NADP octopine/nopaline dehydrogenase family protein [candidate division KSB1 bacterium]MDZ7413639.1 NAD/NADP octopine/nopaline dehydrogenase family protein [candidate division KSB1 bacterium]